VEKMNIASTVCWMPTQACSSSPSRDIIVATVAGSAYA
jgi:hypothetical protein